MADTASAEGEAVTALLEAERAAGTFPSWQAVVVAGEREVFHGFAGDAVVEPEVVPARATTLYDLASLTKPLITGLLALRLAEAGILPLDLPVARLLEEMCEPPRDRVTVLDLLTHRAGFAAWAPFYLEARPPLARFARHAAGLLAHEPGSRVVYSDVGYLILGAAIERAGGRPFAELARSHVLEAVAEDDLLLAPPAERRLDAAATERGNEYEAAMAGIAADDPRLRHEVIRGEVHDGNAHALGGVAPHAGLFGTARAVVRLARAYLDPRLLGAAGRALARADLTSALDAHRSAVFELAVGEGNAGSGVLPPDAIGHTGFTGTSLWIEPARERIYVLLTNRVHPRVRTVNMNDVRRRFHQLAARL